MNIFFSIASCTLSAMTPEKLVQHQSTGHREHFKVTCFQLNSSFCFGYLLDCFSVALHHCAEKPKSLKKKYSGLKLICVVDWTPLLIQKTKQDERGLWSEQHWRRQQWNRQTWTRTRDERFTLFFFFNLQRLRSVTMLFIVDTVNRMKYVITTYLFWNGSS